MKRTFVIILLLLLLGGAIVTDIYFDEIVQYFRSAAPATQAEAPAKAPGQTAQPPAATPDAPPADNLPTDQNRQQQPQQPQQPQPPAPQPPTPPRADLGAPHSAEHAAALQVAKAVQPDAAQEELQRLVDSGSLDEKSAAALRDWAAEHEVAKVEEVGTIVSNETGAKETRYRLVDKDGEQDIIITVNTDAQGKTTVQNVQAASADKTQLSTESDPLDVVEGFVEAVRRGDMGTARRLTSGQDISDATLAGLCMMFEESDFTIRKRMPVRSMFLNENKAGFLVYLTDGKSAQARNIGLELERDAEHGWKIKAVALDNLLNRYEASAEAEGGVYFPLVKNPQGGDSIVLYFGFNDATLSPRSLSQLRIVASLLLQSKGALNISGHTDDVGTEAYNQTLSERRAEAVKTALVSYGVDPGQITTRGLGKRQPLRTYSATDTAQTINTIRSGNRRAEIYLDF